ncbi:MAG: ABC transporter transmembrane domain-containing protein, partial [Acholeplasmataceae bacterium]
MTDKQKNTSQRTQRNVPFGGGPRGMNYLEKSRDFKGTMKKLGAYLKPFYIQIIASAFFAVAASLLTVLGPWLLGLITSEISNAFIGTRPIGTIHLIGSLNFSLGTLALITIGVHFLGAFFNYIQAFLLIGMTQSLTYSMRRDLSSKLNKLPLKFYDDQSFGDVLGRVTNDVETINGTLTQSLSEIFRAVALLTFVITMMFILSPILAGVVLF